MRRADRLFLLIHALRGRRSAITAQQLAQTLQVSLRTVYRDVADLQLSGVPIEGEAGVGYMLRKGADIPPLMFNEDELEALVVGTRFVRAFGGERLGRGATAALLKIEAVLPDALRERSRRTRIFAPQVAGRIENSGLIDALHAAIERRQVLRLDYRDGHGAVSAREVEPLALAFWGGTWTLGAWCRLRGDFRSFRPDRIAAHAPSGEIFADDPARNLDAYLRAVGTRSTG
ncbi:helix-turn-helix transcriptional regulator [Lysobacter solisilvae (ex Woo and Kim 2020)]|uniref:YafY family transcriptional regulator n=1 Tax=Agrilutibacter terrestris TaxID=2865112 RepID=A0A7H0G136_9GAMM|nr:YafY family protein [Lysobacter terrestris]QNP42002.1 YafY family transcriptional regulator [Lysobacter terrestris]